MTRGVSIRVGCVLAGLGLFSTAANAQGIRVFAMGSGSYLFSESFFAAAGDRWRSNYAPGGKITLGGEYSLSKVLGVEGSYAYGRNNLRLTNLDQNQEQGYGVRVQRASGNLMIHSPVKLLGLQPYATAGIEYTRFGPTSEARASAFGTGFTGQPAVLDPSNKIGFNVGGGAEWYVLEALAVRLDIRNHATGTPRFGLSNFRFPVSGTAHNLEVSAGVTIHFGD